MKQLISLIVVLIYSIGTAIGQKEEAKTLINKGFSINTEDIGWFVAPKIGVTQLDDDLVSLFQLSGGINIYDRFSFGLFYTTSLNEVKPASETIDDIYMDYWSVGGLVEVGVLTKKLVHFTLPVYLGYGEVQMDNELGNLQLGESNFFQIEPCAMLELNLHKHLRLNIGTGYRVVTEMNYRNFDQSDLAGLTGYLGLKLGVFK